MKFNITRAVAAATLVLGMSALVAGPAAAQAQGKGLTRAQVTMDRDEFLAMARYDEAYGGWVLKDMAMPKGVKSREEVQMMRDEFLSMHTWNDRENVWVPVNGAPRDMSKLSREKVSMETIAFLMNYRFNGMTSRWEPRAR
jgi:hypothetical protein